MIRILARKLLDYSDSQLWDLLDGRFILIFDDGKELETEAKETLYSSYAWNFHRTYPSTPLRIEHHVQTVLNGKRVTSGTHLELLGRCMWATFEAYQSNPDVTRDALNEMVYRLDNRMYNELSHRLEEHVVSLDITDFINALECPTIKEANNNVKPTEASITDTYNVIQDALLNDPVLAKNPISLAMNSKLVSNAQILQCIGPRGYLTDIDSIQFKYPILRGYMQGINSLYDSLIESRHAALSLVSSKAPLQDAEYFSRRLQLMDQIVQHLHPGDCGSTQYLLWKVRPRVVEGDNEVYKGDLHYLKGKYYLGEDGALKAINGHAKELIGKTIKLRSVIHCAHPDPVGICATCFGELSFSVPYKTNIGHMCCTYMTQQASQSVLSTKHLVKSTSIDPISLGDDDKRFFKVSSDGSSYMLADHLKGKKISLVIPAQFASNISDIYEVPHITDLNIMHVSALEQVSIRVDDGKRIESKTITTQINRRVASMTYALLQYIREKGWVIDEHNNYVIDLSAWKLDQNLLTLPLKHFNMSDHSSDIAKMLESTVSNMHFRDKVVSPSAMLIELFDLVNSKLNVNLAVLEVVLYGTMIISAETNDYGLPKPWTNRGLGVMRMSMMMRSLSAMMAYQDHIEAIVSPLSYNVTNRPDHPLDRVLMGDLNR